jgi:hypothetical protein
MYKLFALVMTVLLALAVVTAGAAAPPERDTTHVVLGPFVDEELCAFPVTTVVERTRRTIRFADGDVRRHTQLIVTSAANGPTVVDRASFNVVMPSGSSTWIITGAFVHVVDPGAGTVALQSGRLLYDVDDDQLLDAHPSPMGADAPICDLLAP